VTLYHVPLNLECSLHLSLMHFKTLLSVCCVEQGEGDVERKSRIREGKEEER